MKSLYFIATTLLSLISANRVIHLNADNFESIVDGTRNVFLKFEASWCGPCKALAPVMDKIAKESFPDLNGETILAAVDADEEREIGKFFNIKAFPTMKLFLKGRSIEDAIDFTGQRSAENITKFINQNIAHNMETLPEELKNSAPARPLTKLLEDISKVEARSMQDELGSGYGNFFTGAFEKAYQADERPRQKNVKQRKGKNKKNKPQKSNQAKAETQSSLFPLVDANQAKSIIASAGSKPVILIFFSPSCGHCHEFLPLAKKLAEIRTDAIFIRVNGEANVQYRDSFSLQYYPSIIGFFANSNGARYELVSGNRGYDHLNSFVNKLLKH